MGTGNEKGYCKVVASFYACGLNIGDNLQIRDTLKGVQATGLGLAEDDGFKGNEG
ncbi:MULTISPECIES: hypothetical protein [Neisseria]|uniref:hypothetical protein n=1 Tax=Neisseria TaxID=482 RepID=UPI000B02E36A|nr:hypothetical protein [Neisseria arctica]UOO87379.1 hypothetical protein LVJ86_03790 [Neisseria arctica]